MKELNKATKIVKVENPVHENFLVEFNLRNAALSSMMVSVQGLTECVNAILSEKDHATAHQQFAIIAKHVQEIAKATATANEHHKKSFHI